MWTDERTMMSSVGLSTDDDTFSFQAVYSPYSRLVAAATAREPDAAISWSVVAGYDATSMSTDIDADDDKF